jgi:protein involved in polysaccharide export with SLBB domain
MQTTRMSMSYAVGPILWSALFAMGAVTDLQADDNVVMPQVVQTAISADLAPATRRASAAALAVGDRVKIAFLEIVDVAGASPSSRVKTGVDSTLRTFLQRTDLSAEYTIDQDGIVSLPRLGKFQITKDVGPRDLEALLAYAFTRATGHPVEVNVTIQDRRPVYVVGMVKNTGAFKHAGHMTVLQAIALAGGIDRGACSTAELIEASREQERVAKLTHQLTRLLARRARLEAERKGSASMQRPSQLTALAGKDGAETMLSTEQRLLELDRARREQQRAETIAGVATARKEIEAMRAKLLQLNAQSQMNSEYLNDLLKVHGLGTRVGVIKVRSDLAEIEARRQDIHAAMAAAEARLAQSERAVARQASEHATELARSVAATEAEVSEVRVALESAGSLAETLGQGRLLSTRSQHTAHAIYQIVRHGREGPVVLPAQENTPLLPDDVLQVGLGTASRSEVGPYPSEDVSHYTHVSAEE